MVGRHLYVRDLDARVTSGHTLDLALDVFLRALDLIFKQEIPYGAAICRSARQLALSDVEGVQEITLDEIKPGQGKFFLLSYGAESNKCSHAVFTPVILRSAAVADGLVLFQAV